MNRPEFPHVKVFFALACLVALFLLVALLKLPDMTLMCVGYGMFSCLMLYPFYLGIRQKCYRYSIFIILSILIAGTLLYGLQVMSLPG